jgi:hypothetical protein
LKTPYEIAEMIVKHAEFDRAAPHLARSPAPPHRHRRPVMTSVAMRQFCFRHGCSLFARRSTVTASAPYIVVDDINCLQQQY